MNILRIPNLAKRNPTRRQLLKALGVTAGLAPMLPALDGWAATASDRKRLLILFTPDGMVPEKWWPTGSEAAWTLPADGTLEPLMAKHKNDMIVMKGLPHKTQGSGAHEQAMGGLLTGNSLLGNKRAGGASIDQIIAKALPKVTDFQVLNFGVHSFYGGEGDLTSKRTNVNSYIIYTGPGELVPAEDNPYTLFDRIFAGVGTGGVGDTMAMDKLRAERRSILDYVKQDITDVEVKVGKQDRGKIAAHLEATREIERRLDSAGAKPVGAIEKPQGGIALDRNANFPMLIPILNKLLVQTLAADRTRVATMQYSRGFSLVKHDWLGAKEQHHFLSHKTAEKPILAAIQKWYMGHINTLLDNLKAIPEGEGSMFDNMLVVYVNELHTGWDHAPGPNPIWWAGKLGGVVPKTGRFLDFAGAYDHNQMLCTMAHAMGVTSVNQVGNMGKGGVIPGLIA
jgi:hypothetical protein